MTSLTVCSRSTNVGFFLEMLVRSTCSRWLDSGSKLLFSHTMKPAKITAARQTGKRSRVILTPLAFMAEISLSEASRLNVYRTATSTAMGRVIASMKGIESPKTCAITVQ